MYILKIKNYEEYVIEKKFNDIKKILEYLLRELDQDIIEMICLEYEGKKIYGYYEICDDILIKI